MGKPAHAIAHLEADNKARDAEIAAKDTTIQTLQATLNQLSPKALDAEDEAAIDRVAARFPDINQPPQ